MTPEVEAAFDSVRAEYGARSIERVEQMIRPRGVTRSPFQQKAKWIMPGIAQRPWHDPYEYAELRPIVEALEARHAEIKAEYRAAWDARRAQFGNYEHYLVRSDDWKALYLFKNGAVVAEAAAEVPVTFGIMDRTAIRTGKLCPLLETHFSTILPHAAIPPHCDLWNFTINLHFAIDIPDGCGIRVAKEERQWTEGKCLLFDYSFEHEAWNRSDHPRTCLLADLWHPEVTIAERKALTALITEIRSWLE